MRIISDEETAKTSAAIYNYMRREQAEDEEDRLMSLHTPALVKKIENKELLGYDAEQSEDTAIPYDAETVQLHLEQFTRYPFRMQRYGELK